MCSFRERQTGSGWSLHPSGNLSVLANGYPKEFCHAIDFALNQDFAKSTEALALLGEINPLMYEEANPVGIKQVLKEKEICDNYVRLPLVRASETLKAEISEALKSL